jgi:GNAT superfamily N-acetyltransferase
LTAQAVSVRPVRPADVEAIVDLVQGKEFTLGQPRDALRLVFDHPWSPDRPHAGFVMTAGDRIVGVYGVIFSTRLVDGRAHRFANHTTWYVEPEYRRHGRLLLQAAMSLEDCTMVVLTASPRTAQTLERAGWEVVSARKLFFGPLARPLTALARGGEILDSAPRIASVLAGEHRRILDDHLPFACSHYLVKERDRYCYVVTKRRWEKGWFLPRIAPGPLRARRYPVSDVLYVSDPDVAMRHWLPLRWRMARRERTVGVTVEESFLGGLAPAAASLPHRIHVYGRRTDPRTIDGLYSEFVLLPH